MNNNTLKNLVLSATFAAVLVGQAAAAPTTTLLRQDAPKMAHAETATTSQFKGIEVNGGKVTLSHSNGKHILKLSNEFVLPKTPAPSWQVVDGEGNVYLLKQLKIAGNKLNKSVTLPSYIKSVAKVQIWCSFAEVVLGEASFDGTIDLSK